MSANGFDASPQEGIIKGEQNHGMVDLEALASLTGFPSEFIKKELLLEGNEVSMDNLREKVLGYLKETDEIIKQ